MSKSQRPDHVERRVVDAIKRVLSKLDDPHLSVTALDADALRNALSLLEQPVPTHRCNGVNNAERHGTQNRCTVCGEYREGYYDSTGMEVLAPVPAGVGEAAWKKCQYCEASMNPTNDPTGTATDCGNCRAR